MNARVTTCTALLTCSVLAMSCALFAEPMPAFSSLSAERQAAIRKFVVPPPLAQRHNPYSTPMYYPMWGKESPDGQAHPEWQELLAREWAQLGMTRIHFYAYPDGAGTSNRSYTLTEATRAGTSNFIRICQQLDLRIGLRVDLPCTAGRSTDHPKADYWIAHPNNPDNELRPYFGWLADLVTLMKGHVQYLILGDEIEWKSGDDPKAWNAEVYLKFFRQAADVVHQADPAIKVSMYATTPSRWREVLGLLESGYAKYGDGVAINHYDYKVLKGFRADLTKYSPNKKLLFLSNGVGYIACDTAERNPPTDRYARYNDLDQAAMIARTMYAWWDIDADVAPYYICMRTMVYRGKRLPHWYGFFGFMDFVIDDKDQATIRRYPGWYGFQTVAQVFHDRSLFSEPDFAVLAEPPADFLKAHERTGRELLLICWGQGKTTLRIASKQYAYPVQIELLDYQKWKDIPGTKDDDGVTLADVLLARAPTIIRLVRKDF